MSRLTRTVSDLPILPRFFVVGAALAGAVGAIVGLVLGMRAYPPTAWFAFFEVGIPAALAGGLVGIFAGLVTVATRWELRR